MGAANSSERENEHLKKAAMELDKRSKEMDKRAEQLDKREKELDIREKELDKGMKELKKAGGIDLLKLKSEESEAPNNCGCWYNQAAEGEEPVSFFCQNTGCAIPRSSPGFLALCCC
ncbi:unnamed protein product [Leuciscus chuanchicus]